MLNVIPKTSLWSRKNKEDGKLGSFFNLNE